MWVYKNGEILAVEEEEEQGENTTHAEAFPDTNFGRIYSGRFESSTGKASIVKPISGILKFRDIPKFIIDRLYDKFPIKELLYF